MLKKFVAALAALLAATAFAAVDANKATQAELEAVSGIGPAISASIVSERKKGDFKDWNDLVVRIKGVGDQSAAKMSAGGLTVNGKTYPGAPAAPAKAATEDKSGVAKAASAVKGSPKTVASTVKEEAHAAKESVTGTKTTAAKTATEDKSGVAKAASAVKGSPKTVTSNVKEEAHAAKESVTDAKAKSAEKKAEKAEAKAEKAAAASAPKK